MNYNKVMLVNCVTIREFNQDMDDIEELTGLLNSAYKQLDDLGFHYVASYQDSETTEKRISGDNCFVAFKNELWWRLSHYMNLV